MPWYSLDVFAAMAEERAQDDQALARRCIEGLTGYAAELRQRAGPDARAPETGRFHRQLLGPVG